MIKLVSGKNFEGYTHALNDVFGVKLAPVKSSFCKLRKKVSVDFFREIFSNLLKGFKRPTWRGLHIYAIDGFEVTLPRTTTVLKAQYTGRRVKHKGQTYYPHMYMVHALDVISKVTKDFVFSPFLDELKGAKELVKKFEQNSLCLYDRLYISSAMITAHLNRNSYFLMRVRSKGILTDISDFIKSRYTRSSFEFEGVPIYLFKVRNPKTKQYDVFATNYKGLGKKAIREIYNLRWEIENCFRDLTETLKAEQLHSKTIDGVLQEIYTRMWIMNFARIAEFRVQKPTKNPFATVYKRANFKLIVSWVTKRIFKIFKHLRGLIEELKIIVQKSAEKRKRHSRSYPRQIRYAVSNYTLASIIYDWESGA